MSFFFLFNQPLVQGVSATGSAGSATASFPINQPAITGVSATGSAPDLGGGTFSRASSASYIDQNGYVVTVGNDVLRYQSSLPLIEPAKTNVVRNPRGEGAVAGSPGTAPTYWASLVVDSGCTRTIVGTGTENGVPYVDVRFNGTIAGTYIMYFRPEAQTSFAVVNDQKVTSTCYIRAVGGSTTNCTNWSQYFTIYDASLASLSSPAPSFYGVSFLNASSLTAVANRPTFSATVAAPTAAYAWAWYVLYATTGQPVDITLRIGAPQQEIGAATSLILPPVGAPGTSTRAAEIIGTAGIPVLIPPITGASGTGSVTALGGGTFSRASTAMYFDANGIMQTAATDMLRPWYDPVSHALLGILTEPAATNYAVYSLGLSALAWAAINTTASANAAIAPDGTLTARLVTETSANSEHYYNLQSNAYTSLLTNVPYTFSIYAKDNGRRYVYLRVWDQTNTANVGSICYDLQTQAMTAPIQNGTSSGVRGSITSVGNGWYRLVLSLTPSTSPTDTSLITRIGTYTSLSNNTSYTGDGVSGVYLWGVQLEPGTVATSIISTASGSATRSADVATAGIPVILEIPTGVAGTGQVDSFTPSVYIPGLGVSSTGSAAALGGGTFSRASIATYFDSAGVVQTVGNDVLRYQSGVPLIEAAATNVAFPSLPTNGWTLSSVTTPTGFLAPDGSMNAYALVENNSNTAFRILQSFSTINATQAATLSVFTKVGGRNFLRLILQDVTDSTSHGDAWFNLSNGTIGTIANNGTTTGTSARITTLANGWYRCTVSCTRVGTTSSSINVYVQSVASDGGTINQGSNGTQSIYFWGIQLEAGTSATSYIATTSGIVTRSADLVSTAGIPVVMDTLNGVAATGTAGSLADQISIPLAGVSATGSTGTVSIRVDDSASPAGVSAAGQAGTEIAQLAITPSGASATGQAGATIAQVALPSVSVATGISAVGGVLSLEETSSLAGVVGTAQAGLPSIEVDASINGGVGIGQSGSVTATTGGNAQIIVSLYSDDSGVPGTFIAIIGSFDASEIGASPTTIALSPSSPISLTPNTRYWIQVTNTLTTTVKWVTLGNYGGIGVSTEFWFTSSGASGANTDGTAYQMAVFVEESIGVTGITAVGQLGTPASQEVGQISGVAGLGEVAFLPDNVAAVLASIGSVQATGLAGTAETTHGKVFKKRSGRGAPRYPPVSVSPDTEPLSDKMARWRKAVADALELPEKPTDEVEEAVPSQPNFSFLSLLDSITQPRVDAEPMATIIQKSRNQMLAEAEDDILLGVSEDDDFQLGLVTI